MNNPTDDDAEFLDAALVVHEYREAVAKLEAATTAKQRAEYDSLVKSLRRRWADYNGGDDAELHEMAFGGPWQ